MHHRSVRSVLASSLITAVVVGCAAVDPAASLAPHATASVGAASSVAPSDSAAATASPAPAPGDDGPLAITWTELTLDGWVHEIATDGGRIVAVGRIGDAFTAWTSTDGAAWEAVAVPPPANFMGDGEGLPEDLEAQGSQMGTLVRLDETLYSIGFFNFMDFVRPVGWRWTDGEAWAFIDSESDFYGAGRVQDAVAAHGAIVAARLEPALSWSGVNSTIWRWTPDASWVRGELTHPDSERTYVNRLAGDGGTLLAAGLLPVGGADDPDAAAVATWESSNGESWSAVEPPAGAIRICALEAHPSGGFLAIGIGDRGVSAWRMTEGQWSERVLVESAADPDVLGAPADVCWVFPTVDGLIALYPSGDGVLAWTSTDGDEWNEGAVVAPQAFLAAADEDFVVLVRPVDHADPGRGSILHIGRIEP